MLGLPSCWSQTRFQGKPVRPELLAAIEVELHRWATTHKVNNRPSIAASSYMILRSPAEFSSKDSKNAQMAAAKIREVA